MRDFSRVVFSVSLMLSPLLSGCGGPRAEPPDTSATTKSDAKPAPIDPKSLPLPQLSTGVVQLYASEPGFTVFIDGVVASDERFDPLTTPCQVTVTRGRHQFTLAKEGYIDAHREIEVGMDEDLIFQPESTGDADPAPTILKAAFYEAPLAEALPLLTLNTAGAEQDPFVSEDGLTIWFISDRPAGRGLYWATRTSPYHAFGAPEYVPVTRSPDDIASPSVTADGLMVAYAVPEKSRLVAIRRAGLDAPFDSPNPIQFATAGGYWPSAQVLGNGLQVFWTQAPEANKPLQTMTATRKKVDRPFDGTTRANLPGGHPCISADGLRQYVFDGKVLRRARRNHLEMPFSELEIVANVALPNYVPASDRRQFFVSNDEQWLFYCDNPKTGGDLFVVRLLKQPGWGLAPLGKAIPPLRIAAAPNDEPQDKPDSSGPKKPTVDPRTLPLPYVSVQRKLLGLMEERQYDEATKLLNEAREQPGFQNDQLLLKWDLEEVEGVKGFWKDVRDALGAKKPGDPVRIGAAKVDFVRFENDVIHAKARTKEVERSIQEMSPVDLAAIIEEAVGRDSEPQQLRMGLFLRYDSQGNPKSSESRLMRGGKAGTDVLSRIPARLIHLAEQEIQRGNPGAGLLLAETVLKEHPGSGSAARALQLNEEVYRAVEWIPIGARKWDMSEAGVSTADRVRSNGSGLRSPREYENFEVRLEWKVDGELGQGGVYFHWNGQDSPTTDNAFKLHLANDAGLAVDMFSTGALFKVESPDDNPSLPEGQWNTLILRVLGEKVTATINGKKVLDTTATSKEIGRRGWVCLDGVIGGISYRKTLLIELPAPR